MRWSETPQGRLATAASNLSSEGSHLEALELLEGALNIKRDPLVLVHYGSVLRALRRYDEAEQALLAALEIDEDLSHGWNQLGMLLQFREEFEKAALCYERSVKISPNVDILTVLANVQLAFDPEKSLENAERALSIDPDWAEARTILDAAEREIHRRSSEDLPGNNT